MPSPFEFAYNNLPQIASSNDLILHLDWAIAVQEYFRVLGSQITKDQQVEVLKLYLISRGAVGFVANAGDVPAHEYAVLYVKSVFTPGYAFGIVLHRQIDQVHYSFSNGTSVLADAEKLQAYTSILAKLAKVLGATAGAKYTVNNAWSDYNDRVVALKEELVSLKTQVYFAEQEFSADQLDVFDNYKSQTDKEKEAFVEKEVLDSETVKRVASELTKIARIVLVEGKIAVNSPKSKLDDVTIGNLAVKRKTTI